MSKNVTVSITLPPDVLQEVERFRVALSETTGMNVHRSQMITILIRQGLKWEDEHNAR